MSVRILKVALRLSAVATAGIALALVLVEPHGGQPLAGQLSPSPHAR